MNFTDLGSYDAIVLAVAYLLPPESTEFVANVRARLNSESVTDATSCHD